jgi:hypothetical protein
MGKLTWAVEAQKNGSFLEGKRRYIHEQYKNTF